MASSIVQKQQNNAFVIEKRTSNQITIAAGAAGHVIADIAKTGYQPLAIAGMYKNGSLTNQCLIYEFWFDDGTLGLGNNVAYAYFRNIASAAATVSVDFYITYVSI